MRISDWSSDVCSSDVDEMLVDQRFDLGAGVGDVEGFVLVALLVHLQQIAESACMPPVSMPGRVRQDQVQALQEFLEINFEISARLDVLERPDGLMHHGHLRFRAGERLANESIDAVHAKSMEVLQQPLVTLSQDRHRAHTFLEPLDRKSTRLNYRH